MLYIILFIYINNKIIYLFIYNKKRISFYTLSYIYLLTNISLISIKDINFNKLNTILELNINIFS